MHKDITPLRNKPFKVKESPKVANAFSALTCILAYDFLQQCDKKLHRSVCFL